MKTFLAILLLCGIIPTAFPQANFIQTENCTINAAYSDGFLDAKNMAIAQIDYAQACDANQDRNHNQLNVAYRNGYISGAANISRKVTLSSATSARSVDGLAAFKYLRPHKLGSNQVSQPH